MPILEAPFHNAIYVVPAVRAHIAEADTFDLLALRIVDGKPELCSDVEASTTGYFPIHMQRPGGNPEILTVFVRLDDAFECLQALQKMAPSAEAMMHATNARYTLSGRVATQVA